MKKKEILIIGTGFIGIALSQNLSKKFKVRTISRSKLPDVLKQEDISHSKCDITNYKKLKSTFGNPFLVIHTAALQIPEINEYPKKGFDIARHGTGNICKIVAKNPRINGLIMVSTMRVFGEYNYSDAINEDSGIRINYARKSSRKYILSQIIRESIVESFAEMSPKKIFGILRVSTVLDSSRKHNFFINSFIEKSIKDGKIIVYKHVIHRPIFFVALTDIFNAIENLIFQISSNKKFLNEKRNHILNLSYPYPLSILESAKLVRDAIKKHSKNTLKPTVKIIEAKNPEEFVRGDKHKAKYDISRVKSALKLKKLIEPRVAIEEMVNNWSLNDKNTN